MKRAAIRLNYIFCRLCLLGLLTLSCCEPLFQREVSGRVMSIEGSGQRRINGESETLTKDSWIQSGETISSAKNSRIDLMLVPGLLIELEGESEIEILNLQLTRDGYETTQPMRARRAKIRLVRGALSTSVGRDPHRPRLIIETTAGSLTAGSGRTCRLETNHDKIRILCVRRKVNFESRDGRRLQVQAGYCAEWPPVAAGPQPAWQLGTESQDQLNHILATEKSLLQLERQNRFASAPWNQKPTDR